MPDERKEGPTLESNLYHLEDALVLLGHHARKDKVRLLARKGLKQLKSLSETLQQIDKTDYMKPS